MPKCDVELGLKLFNTKGGYIEEKLDNGSVEKQHISSRHVDSDELINLSSGLAYSF